MSGPKRRGVTRRETLGFVGGATISLAAGPVLAKTLLKGTGPFGAQAERHGLSIFGDLKYGPDFTHFDYVNPDAPKGGKLALQPGSWLHNQNPQTFNTLNGYVTKGDAPPRLELIFDTLMASAYDEPDAIYGLLAKSVQVSEDGNSFLFHLRPEARFHDGSRLTAYDAAFSISILKQDGHPDFTQSYKKISKIEALSNTHLLIELDGTQSRALILEMAANAPIFSQKFYETQDFSTSSLTPPLASGPYKIGRFEQGRYLEYERVEDYWARDLPIAKGHANFDVIRVDFFRERQTGFEAFKKGEVTFREEFTSKTWATEYEFPAVTDGRVKKMLFPSEKLPSFQGNFINARRSKFADVRTREALGLCFDFEWVNQNLFFGAYARLGSFVEGSVYKANGVPQGRELALLEQHRDQLPASIFGEVFVPPVSDGSGRDRSLLKKATVLLAQAGWKRRDSKLYNDAGEQLTMEILVRASIFERVYGKYVESLRAVGIEANIRLVDPAQYQARISDYDFDMSGHALSLNATPFSSADILFSSGSANTPGTRNWAGINDPVVDALIGNVEAAKTREEHQAAWQALDRVVRAGHYWVPGWYADNHRIAMWDQFGWPEKKPDYYFPVETTWWSTST